MKHRIAKVALVGSPCMDAPQARSLLVELATRAGDRVVMWRGPGLEGPDVDLLVVPGAEATVREVLEHGGLAPDNRHPGRTIWSSPSGNGLEFDVRESQAWPAYYPSLRGVGARARGAGDLPPVASAADRLLILAADAVVGRPLGTVVARARPLIDAPDARDQLRTVADAERSGALTDLIADPERLGRLERRGRLPYSRALPVAMRSRPAKAALATRLSGLARLGIGPALRRRLGR